MQCVNCGSPLTGEPRYCPTCGNPVTPPQAGGGPSSHPPRARRVGWVLFPLVLGLGLLFFFLSLKPSMHAIIADQPVVAAPSAPGTQTVSMTDISVREEGGDIVFPLEDLVRHRLVRFEVRTPTITRPVMAYLAPDGRLVTAISVSEHCGATRFTIRDNKIYCSGCASNWDMMTLEAYACCAKYFPDPIPSRLDAGNVRISRAVIERWAGRL